MKSNCYLNRSFRIRLKYSKQYGEKFKKSEGLEEGFYRLHKANDIQKSIKKDSISASRIELMEIENDLLKENLDIQIDKVLKLEDENKYLKNEIRQLLERLSKKQS